MWWRESYNAVEEKENNTLWDNVRFLCTGKVYVLQLYLVLVLIWCVRGDPQFSLFNNIPQEAAELHWAACVTVNISVLFIALPSFLSCIIHICHLCSVWVTNSHYGGFFWPVEEFKHRKLHTHTHTSGCATVCSDNPHLPASKLDPQWFSLCLVPVLSLVVTTTVNLFWEKADISTKGDHL